MPAPSALRRIESGGQCVVTFGGRALFCYDADDIGMRNMAVVAVTDAGMGGKETAAVFGLTPEYVSMLRGRARREGSAGLVKRRGRPPKLTSRQVATARVWAAEGVSQTEIARRLGVSRTVIHDVCDRLGPAPLRQALEQLSDDDGAGGSAEESNVDGGVREPQPEPAPAEPAFAGSEAPSVASAGAGEAAAPAVVGAGRLTNARVSSRYAGAMLLHAFGARADAAAVLAAAAGGVAAHGGPG